MINLHTRKRTESMQRKKKEGGRRRRGMKEKKMGGSKGWLQTEETHPLCGIRKETKKKLERWREKKLEKKKSKIPVMITLISKNCKPFFLNSFYCNDKSLYTYWHKRSLLFAPKEGRGGQKQNTVSTD